MGPESNLHSHTGFEDFCISDEVETYHGAVRHIAQKVTELIGEELVKEHRELYVGAVKGGGKKYSIVFSSDGRDKKISVY